MKRTLKSAWARLGAGSGFVTSLALVVTLVALQGCTSVLKTLVADPATYDDRVFRMRIYDRAGAGDAEGFENPANSKQIGKVTQRVYGGETTPDQILPYRMMRAGTNGLWEGATMFNGGTQGSSLMFVEDSVPLLRNGDIVDVYFYPGSQFSFKDRRLAMIMRLVCMAEDKECIKRQKGDRSRAHGWVSVKKGEFDPSGLKITPHIDLEGNWLPGRKPQRPPLPSGVSAASADVSPTQAMAD